ncbi:MAG: hypothetical protein ACLTSG_13455 [Lachnospiraceae bacterium]
MKKPAPGGFFIEVKGGEYRAGLERLYFALAARIDLPRAQKRALISDFRRAAEVLFHAA